MGSIVGQLSNWISIKVKLLQRQGEERGKCLEGTNQVLRKIELHDCWEARKASKWSISQPVSNKEYLLFEISMATSSQSGRPSILVSWFSLMMTTSILLAFSITFLISLLISVRLRLERSSSCAFFTPPASFKRSPIYFANLLIIFKLGVKYLNLLNHIFIYSAYFCIHSSTSTFPKLASKNNPKYFPQLKQSKIPANIQWMG